MISVGCAEVSSSLFSHHLSRIALKFTVKMPLKHHRKAHDLILKMIYPLRESHLPLFTLLIEVIYLSNCSNGGICKRIDCLSTESEHRDNLKTRECDHIHLLISHFNFSFVMFIMIFVHMSTYHMHVWYLWRTKEPIRCPGITIADISEPPCEF